MIVKNYKYILIAIFFLTLFTAIFAVILRTDSAPDIHLCTCIAGFFMNCSDDCCNAGTSCAPFGYGCECGGCGCENPCTGCAAMSASGDCYHSTSPCPAGTNQVCADGRCYICCPIEPPPIEPPPRCNSDSDCGSGKSCCRQTGQCIGSSSYGPECDRSDWASYGWCYTGTYCSGETWCCGQYYCPSVCVKAFADNCCDNNCCVGFSQQGHRVCSNGECTGCVEAKCEAGYCGAQCSSGTSQSCTKLCTYKKCSLSVIKLTFYQKTSLERTVLSKQLPE